MALQIAQLINAIQNAGLAEIVKGKIYFAAIRKLDCLAGQVDSDLGIRLLFDQAEQKASDEKSCSEEERPALRDLGLRRGE